MRTPPRLSPSRSWPGLANASSPSAVLGAGQLLSHQKAGTVKHSSVRHLQRDHCIIAKAVLLQSLVRIRASPLYVKRFLLGTSRSPSREKLHSGLFAPTRTRPTQLFHLPSQAFKSAHPLRFCQLKTHLEPIEQLLQPWVVQSSLHTLLYDITEVFAETASYAHQAPYSASRDQTKQWQNDLRSAEMTRTIA